MDNKQSTIKIGLVDDHILIRDALATVINNFENCMVNLLAIHGLEMIEQLSTGNIPDLIILDLNMPQMDGYETAKWLQNNCPKTPVLILTMYDSEFALIRLLKFGVRGFLKKDIHPKELQFAIESTMTNGYYYSNNSTGKMIDMLK